MLRKILPHAAIVLSNMYIVFYLIDRVNSAMSFIDNGITKALLVLLSVISIFNAVLLIRQERRRIAQSQRRASLPRRTAVNSEQAKAPSAHHQTPVQRYGGRSSRFG